MYKEILTAHANVIKAISEDVSEEDLKKVELAFTDAVEVAEVASQCEVDDSMTKVEETTTELQNKVDALELETTTLKEDLSKSNVSNAELKAAHKIELEAESKKVTEAEAREVELSEKVNDLEAANLKLSKESGDEHIDLNANVDEKQITGAKRDSKEIWNTAFSTANSEN